MYRHRNDHTEEPRAQPPTRWSQGRKRQSDGNFRRRSDEEETIFDEKPSHSSDHRPDSFTTPESHKPVSRCKDWGSAVEEEENLMETVEKDLARSSDFPNFSNPEETAVNPMFIPRLAKRTSAIETVKKSDSYQNYIKAVPRHARQARHPQTPDRLMMCSRKEWYTMTTEWRLAIQAWDDPKMQSDHLSCDPRKFSNADKLSMATLAKRTFKINSTKKSPSYKEYIKAVPRHARQARHPRTPDKFRNCNRKIWSALLTKWRAALKEWHPYAQGRNANKDKRPQFSPRQPKNKTAYLYWLQRKSRNNDSEPSDVCQDQNKLTNVSQLEDDADLERRCSSIRELIREHREKQQRSGASSTEQMRIDGNNREEFSRPQPLFQNRQPTPSMALTPARSGESVGGQHLAGPSGRFTANKEYESRREGAAADQLPSWVAAIATSWVAASQHPTPPSQTASTHEPARGIPQSSEHIAAVANTDVLRLIQSIDAHDDEFDHFGKRIAARCRLLPSKVRSELLTVIEGAVAAYELANPAQLPSSAYVVNLIRNQCGVSLSLPTGSLAPHLQPGPSATQTTPRSLFGPVPLTSLPSQPPTLRPSSQTVPPAPLHYPQPTPSVSHLYSHPPPNYYTQPPPSTSVPPPTAAFFAALYKPQFK